MMRRVLLYSGSFLSLPQKILAPRYSLHRCGPSVQCQVAKERGCGGAEEGEVNLRVEGGDNQWEKEGEKNRHSRSRKKEKNVTKIDTFLGARRRTGQFFPFKKEYI